MSNGFSHWLVPWSSKIVVLSWGKPTQPNGAYTTDQFFKYEENVLEIVSTFTYLGIVFTTGGYFNTCFEMLAGQALKAIFKLKSNLL